MSSLEEMQHSRPSMEGDPLLGMLCSMGSICQSTLMDFKQGQVTKESMKGEWYLPLMNQIHTLKQHDSKEMQKLAEVLLKMVFTLLTPSNDSVRSDPHDLWRQQITMLVSCCTSLSEDYDLSHTPGKVLVNGNQIEEYEYNYKELQSKYDDVVHKSKVDSEELIKFQLKCLDMDALEEDRDQIQEKLENLENEDERLFQDMEMVLQRESAKRNILAECQETLALEIQNVGKQIVENGIIRIEEDQFKRLQKEIDTLKQKIFEIP